MDESWRVPIGSVVRRRRSMEQMRRAGGSLCAEDFRDVFGGPPRSVVLRQFSRDQPASPCSSSASILLEPHLHRDGKEHWLRPPRVDPGHRGGKGSRTAAGGGRAGRWVVRTEEGFYNDIFESGGGEGGRIRSRTRSRQSTLNSKSNKSNSSSVMSSEDGGDSVGRPRLPLVDDAGLSSFASKLRPIIVPSRGRGASPSPTIVSSSWKASIAPCARPSLIRESRFDLEDIPSGPKLKVDGDPYDMQFRPHSSPPHAAVGLDPEKTAVAGEDDSGSGTPSSGVSSIYDDIPMATIMPVGAHGRLALQELEKEVAVVSEDDIGAESYGTIEIVPGGKAVDSEGVNEAIAWAKEKFGAASSSPEETRAGDDDHKQRSEMEEEQEEEEEQEHVKARDGLLGRRDEGKLDVATHLERFRGVYMEMIRY